MSKTQYDIEAQLQKQIEDAQSSLTATLEALAHEAQPSVQIEYAKENAKHRLQQFKEDCELTWVEARAGDQEAIKRLLIGAGVATGTAAAIAFCAVRQTRKCRQRRQWRKFTRQLRKTTPPGTIDFSVHADS